MDCKDEQSERNLKELLQIRKKQKYWCNGMKSGEMGGDWKKMFANKFSETSSNDGHDEIREWLRSKKLQLTAEVFLREMEQIKNEIQRLSKDIKENKKRKRTPDPHRDGDKKLNKGKGAVEDNAVDGESQVHQELKTGEQHDPCKDNGTLKDGIIDEGSQVPVEKISAEVNQDPPDEELPCEAKGTDTDFKIPQESEPAYPQIVPADFQEPNCPPVPPANPEGLNYNNLPQPRRYRGRCKFFDMGRCNFGNSCKFEHAPRVPAGVCKFFFQRGVCRFGPDCRFEHIPQPGFHSYPHPPMMPPPNPRPLLILDLNHLLCDRVDRRVSLGGDVPDATIGNANIFVRPNLQSFLEFLFERFTIAVWTSATYRNAADLVHFLFGELERQLAFFWTQQDCTTIFIKGRNKPLFLKELARVWGNFFLFNPSNTVLLDDSPEKCERNPPHTAIHPASFFYSKRTEKECLKKITRMRPGRRSFEEASKNSEQGKGQIQTNDGVISKEKKNENIPESAVLPYQNTEDPKTNDDVISKEKKNENIPESADLPYQNTEDPKKEALCSKETANGNDPENTRVLHHGAEKLEKDGLRFKETENGNNPKSTASSPPNAEKLEEGVIFNGEVSVINASDMKTGGGKHELTALTLSKTENSSKLDDICPGGKLWNYLDKLSKCKGDLRVFIERFPYDTSGQ